MININRNNLLFQQTWFPKSSSKPSSWSPSPWDNTRGIIQEYLRQERGFEDVGKGTVRCERNKLENPNRSHPSTRTPQIHTTPPREYFILVPHPSIRAFPTSLQGGGPKSASPNPRALLKLQLLCCISASLGALLVSTDHSVGDVLMKDIGTTGSSSK